MSPADADITPGDSSSHSCSPAHRIPRLTDRDSPWRAWIRSRHIDSHPVANDRLAGADGSSLAEDEHLSASVRGDTLLRPGVLALNFAGRVIDPHRDGLARQPPHGEGVDALVLEEDIGVGEEDAEVALAPHRLEPSR